MSQYAYPNVLADKEVHRNKALTVLNFPVGLATPSTMYLRSNECQISIAIRCELVTQNNVELKTYAPSYKTALLGSLASGFPRFTTVPACQSDQEHRSTGFHDQVQVITTRESLSLVPVCVTLASCLLSR